MTSIDLEGVEKTYGAGDEAVRAVESLDLSIEDGEFLVIVGPSGCGKTTTLRCIAGLETVSTGRITFDDRDVTDLRARDRDVAMVFQDYALYPHMTVRKNIGFGLRLSTDLPEAEIRSMVEETAELLGIEGLLDQTPDELSGGQQQRVAVGRAIVREPSVFLLDEPLSNLDAKLRDSMRKEILTLQQRLEVTSVYVTHDQTEAMAMGDRVAVMNDGRLQQVGPPEEVYLAPVNRFVAGFLGSPSMNFIDATVERVDGETVVFDGPGEFDLRAAVPDVPDVAAGLDEIVVGIRPEDLVVREDGGFPTEVQVVEAMGDENVVYADCGGVELTARVASRRVSPGDVVRFDVAVADLYLFHPETDAALKTKAIEETREPRREYVDVDVDVE